MQTSLVVDESAYSTPGESATSEKKHKKHKKKNKEDSD